MIDDWSESKENTRDLPEVTAMVLGGRRKIGSASGECSGGYTGVVRASPALPMSLPTRAFGNLRGTKPHPTQSTASLPPSSSPPFCLLTLAVPTEALGLAPAIRVDSHEDPASPALPTTSSGYTSIAKRLQVGLSEPVNQREDHARAGTSRPNTSTTLTAHLLWVLTSIFVW